MDFTVNGINVFLIIVVTFAISVIIIPIVKRLALHVGAMDIPNARKVHSKPIPRMGGLGIFVAFLFGYMFFGQLNIQMISILIGGFLLVMTGVLDDIKPIRARFRFIVHIIAALIVVFYGGVYFDELTILGLHIQFASIIMQLMSAFFIVAIVNALNLIDGLDGLSSGISVIYFVTIAVIAFILSNLGGLDVILSLLMIGSILGYLVYNFHPASIFMGDGGSCFIGFMIATTALLGFKATTLTSFIIPLLILSIPIVDTLLAMGRRLLKGKNIMDADKEHFHHQLLNMKFGTRTTVLIIYVINILFSLVSIFYVLGDSQIAIAIYILLMIGLLYMVLNTNILFERKKVVEEIVIEKKKKVVKKVEPIKYKRRKK